MTFKTHVVSANALSLAIFRPTTINEFIICTTSATIGGIICDLDVVTSDLHKYVDRFVAFIVFLIGVFAYVEMKYHIGIDKWITKNTSYTNLVVVALLFVIACFYGIHQPHRSFMHSIPGTIILSSILYLAAPKVVVPFMIGMFSHITLDLLNKKGIQLFYPLHNRFSLKLCSANGTVNNLIFILSTLTLVIELSIYLT